MLATKVVSQATVGGMWDGPGPLFMSPIITMMNRNLTLASGYDWRATLPRSRGCTFPCSFRIWCYSYSVKCSAKCKMSREMDFLKESD